MHEQEKEYYEARWRKLFAEIASFLPGTQRISPPDLNHVFDSEIGLAYLIRVRDYLIRMETISFREDWHRLRTRIDDGILLRSVSGMKIKKRYTIYNDDNAPSVFESYDSFLNLPSIRNPDATAIQIDAMVDGEFHRIAYIFLDNVDHVAEYIKNILKD